MLQVDKQKGEITINGEKFNTIYDMVKPCVPIELLPVFWKAMKVYNPDYVCGALVKVLPKAVRDGFEIKDLDENSVWALYTFGKDVEAVSADYIPSTLVNCEKRDIVNFENDYQGFIKFVKHCEENA